MNSARIQFTNYKRRMVWSCWCILLINKHALNSSPDAVVRSHSVLSVILCFRLCCQTPSLLCSTTIMGEIEWCWLTERALGGSELFKTLAASWFVNIHLWTDQQICKANEGICQLAQSVTLQSALKIDFIMLKDSQLRESHCQVLVSWSNWLPNGSLQ